MEGAGEAALRLTKYFFELLHKREAHHFISADLEKRR